jgi:hypothetical protein
MKMIFVMPFGFPRDHGINIDLRQACANAGARDGVPVKTPVAGISVGLVTVLE